MYLFDDVNVLSPTGFMYRVYGCRTLLTNAVYLYLTFPDLIKWYGSISLFYLVTRTKLKCVWIPDLQKIMQAYNVLHISQYWGWGIYALPRGYPLLKHHGKTILDKSIWSII
jgi:hypothetical protein